MPAALLPGVASQLVSVLSPLRTAPNGLQAITVLLHPEHLGDVRATVSTNGDQLLVRLAASTNEGAAALRSALPELRQGLADSGQRPIVVLADAGAFGQQPQGGGTPGGTPGHQLAGMPPRPSAPARAPQPLRSPAAMSTVRSRPTDRLLDLRL